MSNALKITDEQAREMPMVDLAFLILKTVNTPFYYRDLMMEIAKLKGLSEEGMMKVIAQLYTEINIDGRFACVGSNLWGLKRWYPIDKSEDGVGNAQRPRIINDDDDEEEDFFPEEEEEGYASDEEDFDSFDEDRADFEGDEEEEEFVDEEMEEDEIDEVDLDEEDDEEDELDEGEEDDFSADEEEDK